MSILFKYIFSAWHYSSLYSSLYTVFWNKCFLWIWCKRFLPEDPASKTNIVRLPHQLLQVAVEIYQVYQIGSPNTNWRRKFASFHGILFTKETLWLFPNYKKLGPFTCLESSVTVKILLINPYAFYTYAK